MLCHDAQFISFLLRLAIFCVHITFCYRYGQFSLPHFFTHTRHTHTRHTHTHATHTHATHTLTLTLSLSIFSVAMILCHTMWHKGSCYTRIAFPLIKSVTFPLFYLLEYYIFSMLSLFFSCIFDWIYIILFS